MPESSRVSESRNEQASSRGQVWSRGGVGCRDAAGGNRDAAGCPAAPTAEVNIVVWAGSVAVRGALGGGNEGRAGAVSVSAAIYSSNGKLSWMTGGRSRLPEAA